MSTFKKVLEVCAVEVMVGGGFLITGVLCAIAGAYDGALVCAAVATVAGVIARMQWKRRASPIADMSVRISVEPTKRKPSKPRRIVKAKKKVTRKK